MICFTRLALTLALILHISCDDSAVRNSEMSRDATLGNDAAEQSESDHGTGSVLEDTSVETMDMTPGGDADFADDPRAREAEFYDRQVVQRIALDIEPTDREAMFAALPERIYVPATFRWNDVVIRNVGVRFKGNSSSNPDSPWKRSLLVKFGEFEDGQRFLGLRRVALDNAIQFGSIFSERLMTDILSAEGVDCSRTNYAEVTINGTYEGLFVNVERIDKSFLERVFQNRAGVLYKNHLGGPGSELTVLDNADAYAESFEPKTHTDEADYRELLELAQLLRDTPEDALEETLERRFNLEPFLKLMAVMVLSGAFDQYTGFNPHNFYLYDDPNTGLISYLVWDLDVGFADRAFGRVPVIDGWDASWPLPRRPRPLLERILSNDTLRARYLAHAERILETYFRPEDLGGQLDMLYAQVMPSLMTDPYPPQRATVPTDRGYPSIVQSLREFMVRRYQTARAQLDSPASEPPPQQPMGQEPMPGASGPDDPTDLRVVRVNAMGIYLSWVDNSEREGLTVVQRCQGSGCETFQNRAGVQPDAPPIFLDDQVQSGETYRYRVYAAWPTPGGPQGSGTSNIVEATP